jgi:hypothetical protein
MSTIDENVPLSIPAAVLADLQEAADRAVLGVRDVEAMRRACERMDRIREDNRMRFGVQDIGVQIIREFRDRVSLASLPGPPPAAPVLPTP